MTNKGKTVSIIIGSYKQPLFLARAINSALGQSFKDFEIIVVDVSEDDTLKDILEPYISKGLIKCLFRDNKGPGATRNSGIKISGGKYIAILDDDDVWIDVDKLQKQVKFLENNPEYGLVGTFAKMEDIKGVELGNCVMPVTDDDIRNRIMSKNCFLHSSIMFRKSFLTKTGLYEEKGLGSDYSRIEDYLLCLRFGLFGKFKNLEFFSVSLTIHEESVTAKGRIKQAKGVLSILPSFKRKYPNFFWGYFISLMRYIFFIIVCYVPIPKSFIYKIQKFYKKV